ncbi:MAG: hypothetical protein U1F43_22375 [Myxococcota bacterium]
MGSSPIVAAVLALAFVGGGCLDDYEARCRAGPVTVLATGAFAPQGRVPPDARDTSIALNEPAQSIIIAADGRVEVNVWRARDDASLDGEATAVTIVVDDATGQVLDTIERHVVGDAAHFVRVPGGIVTFGTRSADGQHLLEATYVSDDGVPGAPTLVPGASCEACELVWSARAHAAGVDVLWGERVGDDVYSGGVRFAQLDAQGQPLRDGTLAFAAESPALMRGVGDVLWIDAPNGSWKVDDALDALVGPIAPEAAAITFGATSAAATTRVHASDPVSGDQVLIQRFDSAGTPVSDPRYLARGRPFALADADDGAAVLFLDGIDAHAHLWVALTDAAGRKIGGDLAAGMVAAGGERGAVGLSLHPGHRGAAYFVGQAGLTRVELSCDP